MVQTLFDDSDKPEIEPWRDDPPSEDPPAVVEAPVAVEPPIVVEPRYESAPPYTPESVDDSVRGSGLAWSAGIVFFSSVAFTLFLGWIADVLLGSSPWGMVGGIVLGSLIGFIQFFRLTSRIFPQNDKGPRSLMSRKDDDPE